ncbi:MAG: adenylate/guanylate cyclase domain-containing protein, partial [Desulfobacterales bacterium]|nr:adenylate/guanylate cyclase domain-containing protein [Desulfobacterales bacterium]
FMEALLWMGATLLLWFMGAQSGLGIGIACGLITVVLAFFWMEYINQNHLIPLFFPDNKPSTVRGAFSVGLLGKVTALIFAVAIVPFTFIQLTINRYRVLQSSPHADLADLMAHMTQAITSESITFLITGMGLSWLLVLNLKKPIDEIIRVLEAVKKGDYRERAQIFSTDEIGFAGERLNAMTEGLAERELIKDRFGKYVDRQIRDEILSGRIPLDGEIKEATILFADLRNFTPLVAVSDPKELIHILNAYFNEMAQAIKAHNGLILQFIGDEVEAVFGAPVDNPGHRTDAVRAALEMRTRLAQLNRDFQRRGIPPLAHGVGIHTGPVLAATIGSDDRAAYSLIGDTVNLASRIQELNKRFKTDILVSSEMADQIHTIARLVPMPRVTVKGKENPIGVFSVKSTHFH